MKNKLFLIVLSMATIVKGQFYNASIIHLSNDALLYTNAAAYNNGSIQNNGTVVLDSNLTQNNLVNGVGVYQLKMNYFDLGQNTGNNTFVFNGQNQTISGPGITRFFDVNFINLSNKHINKNAVIENHLDFENANLKLLNDTLTLWPNCTENLSYLNGTISGDSMAIVLAENITPVNYQLPFASWTNPFFKRPSIIHAKANEQYAIMMHHRNVDIDGFQTSQANMLCKVHADFYYFISKNTNDTIMATIFSDTLSEPNYNTIAVFYPIWTAAQTTSSVNNNYKTYQFKSTNSRTFTLAASIPENNFALLDTFKCQGQNDTLYFSNQTQLSVIGATIHDQNDTSIILTWENSPSEVKYSVTNGICFSDTLISIVNVELRPSIELSISHQNGYAYEPLTITDVSPSQHQIIQWIIDGIEQNTNNPQTANFGQIGTYPIYLKIESPNGCHNDTTKYIDINSKFEIPNLFTPNGDDYNDTYKITALGITKYTIYIYDKWGNEVYKGNEQTAAWDGHRYNGFESAPGQYSFTIEATATSGQVINKSGTLELSR